MRQYIEKLGYRPRMCVWELTLACNASCLHCGSRAGKPRDGELETAEALRVAGELAALGCEHVTLSGGEPLLRRDWPLIARTLVDAGVSVGMISNGLAFGPREARQAVEAGLSSVAFSVDGLETVHDRMRNRPGGFRRVEAAFGAAREAGLPACAVSHVHRDNLDDLDEMHERLRELGVRSWKLQLCNPAGEASAHRDIILRPRDLLRLVPKMVEIKDRGLPFLEASDSIGYFGPYEQALRRSWRPELSFWTGCYAGCRAIGIESHGNVKGCLALPSERNGVHDFIEGNIRSSALADIWLRPGAFAYNREFHPRRLGGFCRTCPYGEICRAGCHWTALAQGGTLLENRFCYYRVSVEAERARKGPRRWFVQGLAPAAIVATLGVTGCWDSYHELAEEPDATADASGSDDAAAPDVPAIDDVAPTLDAEDARDWPVPMYGPARPDAEDSVDVPPAHYGPAPVDAGEDSADVPAGWYGPPPADVVPAEDADVHCPTPEEVCCSCEYMGPPPIPEGCPDPCIELDYGEPTPVPDAGTGSDAAASPDAAGCPDPCDEPAYCLDYGEPCPPPFVPPGCPYVCGGTGTETCPTAEEACCACDYDGPYPIPPECLDPCLTPSGKKK
jgi:radical SAM protein with 4Fe4S-binding SPASM domain